MKNLPDDLDHKTGSRVLLFLQTHPSSFSRRLADELIRSGYRVHKINFCLGDRLYWGGRDARSYRGSLGDWPAFLRHFIEENSCTDILYYGDRRPYHITGAEVGRAAELDVYNYEFGYLRPDWITIERFGMSRFSHFPNDPAQIVEIAKQFGAPDLVRRYPFPKSTEIFHEVVYNLASFLLPFTYPRYVSDRYYNLIVEYLSGIPGLFGEGRAHRKAQNHVNAMLGAKQKFFLFPLQLQSDYQLRDNARFAHQSDATEFVLKSFTAHADPDQHIIFKIHPLDNGWEGWPKRVKRQSEQLGIAARVHIINGGDLDVLLSHALGCVTINSTVGLIALQAGCPVHVLGSALYDIHGLCHKGTLDKFWQAPMKPDEELTDALIRAMAGTIQVKGNFFSKEGQDAAIPAFVNMLLENRVNGAGAYVDPPPRLSD